MRITALWRHPLIFIFSAHKSFPALGKVSEQSGCGFFPSVRKGSFPVLGKIYEQSGIRFIWRVLSIHSQVLY